MTEPAPSPTRDPTAPGPAIRRSSALTGTTGVLGLYLRLDRTRILLWAGAIALLFWASIAALAQAFPDAASRQARAVLVSSPGARLMTGPGFGLDDYTFGALVANEMGLFTLVLVAVLGITVITRHTRAEEESGRMELIGALPVGALAAPVAALLTVSAAQLVVGLGVVAALLATGLEPAGSLAFGLSLAVTGMVFAAVSAVTAQITEHARTSTGMALAVLGAAFLVRGIGDTTAATGSWVSWLSPIAWAQQTRVYVDLRLWPLALSVGLTVALFALAFTLARRRDLGAGLRPPRPGPAVAAARLRSVPGIAHRLLRGSTLGWGAGMFVLGAATGTIAGEIGPALQDLPALTEWVAIDLDRLDDSYAATMLVMVMVGPMAQLVAAVLRWRSEDEAGRVAGLIVTGTGRVAALLGWLAVAALHAVCTALVAGLGLGLGMAAGLSEPDWAWRVPLAALASVPGVLAGGAVAAALVGLFPRWAGAAWAVVVWALVVAWLGELLGIPQAARYLSPLHASASVPADPVDPVAVGLLLVLTVVLVVLGVSGFRRRDLLA